MLITRNVKLLSPLLARRMNPKAEPRARREFDRQPGPDGTISLPMDIDRWNWAFLEARDALGYDDVATAAIIPVTRYCVKSTSNYPRRFRRGMEECREDFESLKSGQVLSWTFTLSKHCPPGCDGNGRFTRAPDEEEFDKMLSHIGEYLGMSEWGHAYLYGRFTLKKDYEICDSKGRGLHDCGPGPSGRTEVPDAGSSGDG